MISFILNLIKMIHKIPNEEYSWDELIDAHKEYISKIAEVLDVKVDYLIYHTDFIKALTTYNKQLCVNSLNKAIERLNEINNR